MVERNALGPREKSEAGRPVRRPPRPSGSRLQANPFFDPVIQTNGIFPQAAISISSFDGQGLPDRAVAFPPDTTDSAGRTQFVQSINITLSVFDKDTGRRVLGPVLNSTLFRGFGGLCESNDDGDPIVIYDRIADRWVISQFALDPDRIQDIPVGCA